MENLIQKHRAFVASQIEKSFNINIQSDEVDIEKAHKDGDMHPNGKWVWVQAANGGKGDWRVAGARTHKNASAGAIPSSDVKPVTAKEFSKNKNAVVEMLKNCDSKTDSNGDKRYHCEFYAWGKDRGSAWFKKSDIEAYLRSYDDAKITPIKSDNASKEQKFKQSFKDASDDVLQKVVDGKIQASSEEKKWAQDILDERKVSDVKTKAAKKIIDLLKVASSKYTDISKVVAWKTDRGNYYLDYDGAETGITVDKDVLSDKDFENAGVKVEGDSKSNASSNDPRDKQAQEAGFKDYAELKDWQDYGTAKSLLKKKSTNNSLRKQLQDKVAKYEKEHADVIKRVTEKKDGKKNTDSSGRAVYYKTLTEKFDKTGECKSTDALIAVYKENDPSKNIKAARALRKYIMEDLNYIDSDNWTKTLNEYKKLRLDADKGGDRDAYKAYDCAYQAVKDRIAKDAKKKDNGGKKAVDSYASVDIKSLTSSVQDAYSKVYNWIKEDEENGNPHSNGGKKILDYLQNIEGNLKMLSQGKASDEDLRKLQDDVKSLSSAWDAVGYGESNLPISKEDVTKLISQKKVADGYSSMDIKDAKKALVGKVVTLADYWPDGRGGSQDAIGEIKNVRLYGKNKTPIAEVVYPNGDEQLIRLDEIDDGKMKDSYKTAITIGDDKTKLDAIKKKISNNA